MSIDRINRSSFINMYNSNSNKTVKQFNKTKEFDSIEISSLARSLQGYSYDMNIDSTKKIAELRTKIQNQTYNVDAKLTAQSIVKAIKGE